MGSVSEATHSSDPGQTEATLRLLPPSEFPNLLESIPFAGEFFEHGFEFGVRALARGLLVMSKSG